jgi:hypothetical protein
MKSARRRLAQFTCIAAAAALVVLVPRPPGCPAAAAAVLRAPARVSSGKASS